MMIMTIITYSWYFLLGPTLLQANETMLARIVQMAYPFADLLLILCVCSLLSHSIRPSLRPAALLFSLALVILAISDSISTFQTLHGTYVVGELLDVGWPLSYLLIGVAVKSVRLSQLWQPAAGRVGTGEILFITHQQGNANLMALLLAICPDSHCAPVNHLCLCDESQWPPGIGGLSGRYRVDCYGAVAPGGCYQGDN